MKKLLVVLVLGLLILSTVTMAYAEEDLVGERTEKFINNEESTRREKPDRGAMLLKLFETYNPDALEDFLEVKADHEAFHVQAATERETHKAEAQAAVQELRADYQAGNISQEELRASLEQIKADHEAFKAQVTIIIEAKQAAVAANKADMQMLREAIKSQIQNEGDPQVIAGLLESAISLLEEHVSIDWEYYNQIQMILN